MLLFPQKPNEHVCICVYVLGGYSLMPSQYAIVLQTSTVIYVKILSLFVSSMAFVVSFSSLESSHPLPSHNVRQCPFFARSILLSRLPASLPGYIQYIPDRRPVLIPISVSYTLPSLHLTLLTLSFLVYLFHVLLLLD